MGYVVTFMSTVALLVNKITFTATINYSIYGIFSYYNFANMFASFNVGNNTKKNDLTLFSITSDAIRECISYGSFVLAG